MNLRLADIDTAGRSRKVAGDVAKLAKSIENIGLLHPVVVTPDHKLVVGWRRIEAFKLLGRDSIPVNVAKSFDDLETLLTAEQDENTCREAYTITEAVALAEALEEFEQPRAKERQGTRTDKHPGKLPEGSNGDTRDKVAPAAGMSARTYEKAKAVVDSKDRDLIDEMDRSGKVDGVHRKLLAKQRVEAEQQNAATNGDAKGWTLTAKQDVVECAAVITDPPYGILSEEWEPSTLEPFARKWLSAWNECGADSFLVFWSQRFLWEGRKWFDESLTNYEFQQLLIWHYRNNTKPHDREGFKQTWEPIFFYRHRNSDRKMLIAGAEWGDDMNDFDCHVAAVPQSNFKGAEMKQHAAQKPVSVMRWLIGAATVTGELVADPFCGSGTTGIAAVQLGRRFHGIETQKQYLAIARGRIATYGQTV